MRLTYSAIFALALSLFASRPLMAQEAPDPAQIAAAAIERMDAVTEACIARTAGHCRDCVQHIRALVEAGELVRARALASECAEEIGNAITACQRDVLRVAQRSIAVIHRAGGDEEVINEVQEAARADVEKLNAARARCLRALRAALSRPPIPTAG